MYAGVEYILSNKLESKELSNDLFNINLKIDVLLELSKKIVSANVFESRKVKYKLDKYLESDKTTEKIYAINKIVTDAKGIDGIPNEQELLDVIEATNDFIVEEIAKRYVQNEIEAEVENIINEKQDQYVEDMRLSILNKKKGKENSRTRRKLEELKELDKKSIIKTIQNKLRPSKFSDIVGQERAIKAILSKIASPYPQHIILYGPPGVGKTTAARIALNEAKELKYTPYSKDAKFVEVDGTTLRWDPREITNPLLGSVHDPIYQGSKRDLSDLGVPEPKPGLVTEAHGGVLFIDEIGELDSILQNKLLKVLEDKRVEFSSSYYDPDDENTPKYIKYLFENGAPADFVLIGATTREPAEINPALRSRCTEVYFEPLTAIDIQAIVEKAAEKIDVELGEDVAKTISMYTMEGRKAINILSDIYGYVLYNKNLNPNERLHLGLDDLQEVISISRLHPVDKISKLDKYEVGHIHGLGVSGYMGSTIEIEAAAFKANEKGKGRVRFNDTAGSMAKDSVFNAATVLKKFANVDINDYDIHVNVVGGGKIDGPSAGAAITICIMSAILDKPIRQDVAVTGEISLRGKVKPVGGIFEKVYGARRKGINLVIVPEENKDSIPVGLKDIEVKTVEDISEIIELIFKQEE